jgi:hypothetical protein
MAARDYKIIDTSGKDGLPAPESFDHRHPEGTVDDRFLTIGNPD